MHVTFIHQKVFGVIANIRTLRRLKGYTQRDMAAQMDISEQDYKDIENAQIALTVNDVVQIAFILDTDIESLLRLDEPRHVLRLVI